MIKKNAFVLVAIIAFYPLAFLAEGALLSSASVRPSVCLSVSITLLA